MIPCTVTGCLRILRNRSGFTQHLRKAHPAYANNVGMNLQELEDVIDEPSREHSTNTFRTPLHEQRHRASMQLPRLSAL